MADNTSYLLAGALGGAVIAYFVLSKPKVNSVSDFVQALQTEVQEAVNPHPIIDPDTVFNALQQNAYDGAPYSAQTVPVISSPGDNFNVGNGLADQIPIGNRMTLP